MKIKDSLLKELGQEAAITRKFLAIVPPEKFSWKPHEKSMSLLALATHIAELPGLMPAIINTDGLDLATLDRGDNNIESADDLTALFNNAVKTAEEALRSVKEDEALQPEWVFQFGSHVISKTSKYEALRNNINHTLHHRAQLSVYLRLLDIPIPGSYGPSADEAA